MLGSETDEIIEELFESLLQKYLKGLEESMKGSEFVFDTVDLLHCKLHKIVVDHLYIHSSEWLKKGQQLTFKIMMINAFNML